MPDRVQAENVHQGHQGDHGPRVAEVEAVLRHYQGVEEAAVVAANRGGAPRLEAWLAVAEGVELDGSELRTGLALRFPSHLLPTAIYRRAELPRTSCDQIDRAALCNGIRGQLLVDSGGAVHRPPSTPAEHALALIWCAILGVDGVGRDDFFLDLGAQSLAVIRLQAYIHLRFGVEIALCDLFLPRTLTEQAALIVAAERAGGSPDRDHGRGDDAIAWWKRHLAGAPPPVALHRPPCAAAGGEHAVIEQEIQAPLARVVRDFHRRAGTTLFVTLLAAFDALLYRATGQRDLVFGSAVKADTLLLRTVLAAPGADLPTFGEQVARRAREVPEMLARRGVSSGELMARHCPLLFSADDTARPGSAMATPGADLSVVVMPEGTLRPRREGADEGFKLAWSYAADLFERPAIEDLGAEYLALLEVAVTRPGIALGALV